MENSCGKNLYHSYWESFLTGRPIRGRIKNIVKENELDVILKCYFSESAKILIETLQNTEEGSSDGIQKISKYFTVGFFKDMEKYYDTVLKSERVKLDTKAEMLVFARKKAKMSAMGYTIQSNLEKERNSIHRVVGELVQERAYIQFM